MAHLASSADLQLITKLDLDEFLTHFSTYLARPKPIYLQGDIELCHSILREMDSMQLPLPPALSDFSHAFLLLQKQGVLSLQDLWGFAREVEFFTALQNTLASFPESKLHALIEQVFIPPHLRLALCIFDEKGQIQEGRFAHIDNLCAQLSATQESITQALNALLASENLAPYLVDKQIHLLYDSQTLLLKAGYSRVLKGSVLDRTQGGFFYVLPNSIARLYDKLQELRDLYALEIQKLCANLSDIARGELRFLRFLDRQFDMVDLLLARVKFAKDLGLEFISPKDGLQKPSSAPKSIILQDFCHPILKHPKPISIVFDKGLLLLTGVNAGGKTMLLKSILSAVFLAKHLLPMKINPHRSQVPHYKHIYAIISNPQNSRDDISTFAGRVRELSWQLDKDDLLLGIDEIELGTDADEAASLYKVFLELMLEKHSKLVVTTHHKRLAALMAQDSRVQLAAAMFDVEHSSATYTFLHGSIGKSYAFEIAQKFGLPARIIARAREHYGSDKERLNALIEQSSSLSLELESKAKELQKRIQKAKNIKQAYSDKIDELEQAYKARERELESIYNNALQALKAQAHTQQDIHRSLNKAHEILRQKPKSSPKPRPTRKEFAVGDIARYGEQSARIIRIQKQHCLIELDSGMRIRVEKGTLTPSPSALANTFASTSASAHKAHANRAKTTLSYTPKASIKLDLHGLRAEEALEKLGDFISDSLIAGFDEVLIFHGIGTGVLSAVVKDFLQNHPKVLSFSDAPPNMGGYGAKLVRL